MKTYTIDLFRRQIVQIERLESLNYDDAEVKKWDNFTEQLIVKAFGKPHENVNDYHSARRGGPIHLRMSDQELQTNHLNGLKNVRKLLEGFIEQLQLFATDHVEGVHPKQQPSSPSSNKVFIVHGHDDKARTELTLMLTRLGVEPIILYEQPSGGKTLIEKLVKHSDVGFAFILLTPDDLGRAVNEKRLQPRARQNAVFEFGLFVGKLGRERCCVLHTGNIELPSDLNGLVYLPFNSSVNEIEISIVRELRNAGYKVSI